MAIVFVSPQKRQRIFFWTITFFIVLILLVVFLTIFPIEFKSQRKVPATSILPTVKINFDILNSNQFKNLEPFSDLETGFIYTAENQNGERISGKVSADSQKNAQIFLQSGNLKIISLEPINTGRQEPFAPYYQLLIKQK